MRQHKTHGYITGLVIAIISIALTTVLLINRQFVVDQVRVWQYQPSDEIAAFADRTTMTDRGTFLFYASQPALEETQVFNGKCARIEQGTAILGCYDGQIIYIYNIPNPKLDGIREVTSVHEMLHAAYQRLDGVARKKVDALLEVEYEKLKDSPDFSERMAFYARTEPGERSNELHSIIGTEVASISDELEAHYADYLTDRSKVLQLHQRYAAVFASLQARGKELSIRLSTLADSIEHASSRYNAGVTQLNADIAQFNARSKRSGFMSQAEFDRERSSLVTRANTLDGLRAAINRDRAEYETLRKELMTVASESEALNKSIDSSLAPAPSL